MVEDAHVPQTRCVWVEAPHWMGEQIMILKQRVPPESYHFKELHFDGICLMGVDLLSET